MLIQVIKALAGLSASLNLWQWTAAARFHLHKRRPLASALPAVTILKPLKGHDTETRVCLESWFTQDYQEFEILFGVSDPDDPVCETVRELQAKHPKIASKLVICDLNAGPNRKVAKLAFLEPMARYQIIVVSDADVKAPVDFLQQTVPVLLEEETGLVNCFYLLSNPVNLAMRWEALAVNSDFWSGVLQARSLKPIDFALGAVMTVRRSYLDRIGGFRRLAGFLADDYQLGSQIARIGGRIEISPILVECRDAPLGFRQVWHHQLRWTRTIRVCQPVPFFFSILNNATLWPALWLAMDRRSAVLLAVGFLIMMRMFMAGHLQGRLTKKGDHWPYIWLAPVKDLLQFILLAASFGGSKVLWRGEMFRVSKGGLLLHPTARAAPMQEVEAG